ncbi:baseplate assembly protein [Tumebacillus permanentifrigoris]|uniref:Phage-related baseplate assembly protein n=1 Tax=Tumebacillus permanentifrigoris TaxID=378543 RepID=A0A316DDJ8_9BACL|nr:baseplate J/gp47 family protein [Tumebacillus permanentifrigoris]PWK16055.1 phage-related baseplate assembly protein [Tumebacillus permanentifrigoris]
MSDLQFVDSDIEKTTTELIAAYESITNKKLFPADPVRLFVLSIATIIVQQRTLLNLTGKQNRLRYASGDFLDGLGEFVETTRLEATAAKVLVRFSLSAPQTSIIYIPSGRRVTPGAGIYFATIAGTELQPGAMHADIWCECLQAGTLGNGFVIGQINSIVDPQPWLARVENITISAGGSDREDDEPFRERIRSAPEKFSVAGPDGAYRAIAKSVDSGIIDVVVTSPSPGVVEIRPLMEQGEMPTSNVINAVLAACSDKRVRPLTDHVTVLAPDQVAFEVDFTYWISSDRMTDVAGIQSAVQFAVDDYVVWQKSKLGRDINGSELTRRILNAGASRAEVRLPIYYQLEPTQVASDDGVSIVYGGLEDA